jgi:hypothetical protein
LTLIIIKNNVEMILFWAVYTELSDILKMIKILKRINPEYKTAAVFAFAALFVSSFTGVIAGIKFGVVLARMLFSAVIFAGLGWGAFFVIRKYVPELLASLASAAADDDSESSEDSISSDESGESDGFTELGGGDFPRVDTAGEALPSASMGKHIVEENSDFPYEPEMMAQAVRTMMSKDDQDHEQR